MTGLPKLGAIRGVRGGDQIHCRIDCLRAPVAHFGCYVGPPDVPATRLAHEAGFPEHSIMRCNQSR